MPLSRSGLALNVRTFPLSASLRLTLCFAESIAVTTPTWVLGPADSQARAAIGVAKKTSSRASENPLRTIIGVSFRGTLGLAGRAPLPRIVHRPRAGRPLPPASRSPTRFGGWRGRRRGVAVLAPASEPEGADEERDGDP